VAGHRLGAPSQIRPRQIAIQSAVRRRFAPHQLRHALVVGLAPEGVAVNIIHPNSAICG
jgi:site-specific recombinase XerD